MSELQKDPNEMLEPSKNEAETPKVKKFETEGSTIFAKHEYDTKKPAQKGGLKRILTCVIAVVLCLAIGGSILLVNKLIPDDEGGVNSIENRSITLLQKSKLLKDSFIKVGKENALVDSNIASVTMINSYDKEGYVIVPHYVKPNKSDSSSSSTSSMTREYDYTTNYKLEGIDASLVLPKVVRNHVYDVLNLVAMQEMSNTFSSVAEYHAYYGIDKPTRVCVIKFNDGTDEIKISVGKQVSTGSADYVHVSGSDKVYIVSSEYIGNYDRFPTYFADPEVIPIIEQTEDNKHYFTTNGDLLKYDYLKISGSLIGQEITFTMNTGASATHIPYRMTKPYNRPASNVFIGKILDFARDGVKAENVYTYNSKGFEEFCGLTDPKYVVELKAGDYHFKLIIGGIFEEGTDNIAAMVEGKPMIYSLMPSHVAFLTDDLNAMFSPDFIMDNISEIKTITYKDSTGTHAFNLTHTKREDSENAYDSKVTYKGAEMNIKSFKLLYQRALMLSLMTFVTTAEQKPAVLTIELTYNSGEKKKFSFTEKDGDQFHYIAWCDGQPYGEVLATSVNDVISSLATYLAGGEIKDIY